MEIEMSEPSRLRPISPLASLEPHAPEPSGNRGRLEEIAISRLGVDTTYQREMGTTSMKNILRICNGFSWTKFLPVIVVPHEDGFAIVDGQHRVTAAATLGITSVPCYVLEASYIEAAAAFAAINGQTTKIMPVDIWFSRLACRDPEALATKRVLDAAGVRITRKHDKEWHVGETDRIAVIERARKTYGDNLLITILQCITETGDGNPGLLSGMVINGIGKAIETKTSLLEQPSLLFRILDDVCLEEVVQLARIEAAAGGNPAQFVITREINKAIRKATVSLQIPETETAHA